MIVDLKDMRCSLNLNQDICSQIVVLIEQVNTVDTISSVLPKSSHLLQNVNGDSHNSIGLLLSIVSLVNL